MSVDFGAVVEAGVPIELSRAVPPELAAMEGMTLRCMEES